MHEKTILQFSGGKDSLACLYVSRPYWDQLIVVWVNTGDAYPETIEQMDRVRALVPHFLEVRSDQPGQIERCGYPSDVVPVWNTPFGRAADTTREFKVQDPFSCCGENIWRPMAETVKRLGARMVIRGQRNDEQKKSGIRSGHVEDGVYYALPIQNWSAEDVFAYLISQRVEVPKNYLTFDTSLDCRHCTAYLDEKKGRFEYMKLNHPMLHKEVVGRVDRLIAAAEHELRTMRGAIA